VASDKSTYPALLTLEGAKEKLAEHYHHAIHALDQLPINTSLLRDFASYIVHRKN